MDGAGTGCSARAANRADKDEGVLGEFLCSSRRISMRISANIRAYKDEGVLGEVAKHRIDLRLVRLHVVAQPVDDHLLL